MLRRFRDDIVVAVMVLAVAGFMMVMIYSLITKAFQALGLPYGQAVGVIALVCWLGQWAENAAKA